MVESGVTRVIVKEHCQVTVLHVLSHREDCFNSCEHVGSRRFATFCGTILSTALLGKLHLIPQGRNPKALGKYLSDLTNMQWFEPRGSQNIPLRLGVLKWDHVIYWDVSFLNKSVNEPSATQPLQWPTVFWDHMNTSITDS